MMTKEKLSVKPTELRLGDELVVDLHERPRRIVQHPTIPDEGPIEVRVEGCWYWLRLDRHSIATIYRDTA